MTPSLRKDGTVGGGATAAEPAEPPPFRRVLIANRGEIAVRIIRACHEMGMAAVAIFSDADADALHVRLADEAVRVGAASPSESYLRIDAIVDAAVAASADAIHPGYGFLSERATFARAVRAAGLTWVGPSPEVIEAVGDKLEARRAARGAGVPVVPGTLERAAIGSPEAVRAAQALVHEATDIGFPLLVKAAAGGGGRGMRRVERAADLPAALSLASAEAESAFGDGSVYLEREIRPARHVEVQLLGDSDGTVVALGERDCSIQRRHQKLVEEAPAPGLTRDERATLHEHAVRLGRAVRLTNAATAEFLFDDERRFWFLEVNTRLQVEHGVTELVSGVDIVREQFRVAAGRPLSDSVRRAARAAADPARHAIEVRLTAEDPGRDFAPTPGTVDRWAMPAGPGVRVDSGVEAGDTVRPEYDNLFAKLLVVDDDRASAIRRLGRALDEVSIGGLQTTVPLYRAIARDESFRSGDISTDWLAGHWDGTAQRATAMKDAVLLAGLAFIDGRPGSPPAPLTPRAEAPAPHPVRGWRAVGRREAIDHRPR